MLLCFLPVFSLLSDEDLNLSDNRAECAGLIPVPYLYKPSKDSENHVLPVHGITKSQS